MPDQFFSLAHHLTSRSFLFDRIPLLLGVRVSQTPSDFRCHNAGQPALSAFRAQIGPAQQRKCPANHCVLAMPLLSLCDVVIPRCGRDLAQRVPDAFRLSDVNHLRASVYLTLIVRCFTIHASLGGVSPREKHRQGWHGVGFESAVAGF